jgi:hypothetical protein
MKRCNTGPEVIPRILKLSGRASHVTQDENRRGTD